MKLIKLTPEQVRDLVPYADVREAFMRREDIKDLPEAEQEKQWTEHKVFLDSFIERLSNLPAIVPSDYDPERP